MGGSSTTYYVSSSTFPLFDRNKRPSNYLAGLLDYSSNSTIEQSEYFRSYYNTSRLRDLKCLLNWAKTSGYNDHMGNVTSTFYADAQFDNDAVTVGLAELVPVGENQKLQVYLTNLNRFSEDFWIRYIATQQGLAYKFYDLDITYSLEFPDENTIKCVFSDGTTFQGTIPSDADSKCFLEISYSIETTTETQEVNPDTQEPTTVSKVTYTYGYYDYKEGGGSEIFDNLIANNRTNVARTFYPTIPIRTDTHWLSGDDATHINNILKKLHIYNARDLVDTTPYEKFKEYLIKGCNENGTNLGDIDYMTVILGVTINSRNKADNRYLFEFFYNLYVNYALSIGNIPQNQTAGYHLEGHTGFLAQAFSHYYEGIGFEGYDESSGSKKGCSHGGKGYSSFNIRCYKTNLNLTYWLGHAEYFECNGKWKDTAQIGECGVLAGRREYKFQGLTTVYDPSDGTTSLQSKSGTTSNNVIMFCKQTSANRFHMVMFIDLHLQNLVYHGKSVCTDAYDDIKDSSTTTTIYHDFQEDFPNIVVGGTGWKNHYVPSSWESYDLKMFEYVDTPGREPSAFIVPLEQSTLFEIGEPYQLDVSYGCQYLICNAWDSVTTSWWEDSFLGGILGAICIVIAYVFPVVSFIFYPLGAFFLATAALQFLQKILVAVFGEKLGAQIYNVIIQIIKQVILLVASLCFKIPVIGWIVWAICMAVYTVITVADYVARGYSIGDALKRGLIEGAIASAASAIGAGVGGGNSILTKSVTTGLNTTGQSLQNGSSVGSALGQGFIAGGAIYAGAQAGGWVGNQLGGIGTTAGAFASGMVRGFTSGFLNSFGNSVLGGSNFRDAFKNGLISGSFSAGMSAAKVGYDQLSRYMQWGQYSYTPAQLEAQGKEFTPLQEGTSANNALGVPNDTTLGKNLEYLGSLDPSKVNAWDEFSKVGVSTLWEITKNSFLVVGTSVLENPNTYANLLTAAYAQQMYHKMANIANDYEEFNDKYRAATKVLNMLNELNNSTVTAEFVCMLQACMGRMANLFPEFSTITPENWLNMATLTGHDQLKNVLAGPSTYVDSKMTLDGYTPYQLHYTARDPDLTFTETSTITS